MKKILSLLLAKTNQSGFTLVEIIMYFALSTILLVFVGGFFITMLESKSQSHAVSNVESDGQFIINRLRYDISRASEITLPTSLGETSTSLSLVIDGQDYIYKVVDGVMLLSTNSDTLPLHTQTQVSGFNVTKKGNVGGKPVVDIEFSVTSPIIEQDGQKTEIYQTTIGTR